MIVRAIVQCTTVSSHCERLIHIMWTSNSVTDFDHNSKCFISTIKKMRVSSFNSEWGDSMVFWVAITHHMPNRAHFVEFVNNLAHCIISENRQYQCYDECEMCFLYILSQNEMNVCVHCPLSTFHCPAISSINCSRFSECMRCVHSNWKYSKTKYHLANYFMVNGTIERCNNYRWTNNI